MRRVVWVLTIAATVFSVAASPAAARGERAFRGSCHDGAFRATAIIRTHLLTSPKNHKTYRTVYRIVYRLRGMDPDKRRSLTIYQITRITDAKTGKPAPAPGSGTPRPFASYDDSIISDGRGHTVDSGRWYQRPAFWGSYILPDTDGVLKTNFYYLLQFTFQHGIGKPSCAIRFPY